MTLPKYIVVTTSDVLPYPYDSQTPFHYIWKVVDYRQDRFYPSGLYKCIAVFPNNGIECYYHRKGGKGKLGWWISVKYCESVDNFLSGLIK